MEYLQPLVDLFFNFVDIMLHLDVHLTELIQNYGTWTYVILFLVIFAETGLVVTPFLPGDSLLFALGALCATGALHLESIIILLCIAAVLGDTVNYSIGNYLGPKVFHFQDSRFFKKEHLEKTHQFYEKHGGKTIIFARFLPIFRTFAPFVAGIGSMTYSKFIVYNIVGGVVWVVGFTLLGFFFGNLPVVKSNFSLVIFGIIIVSAIPAMVEVYKAKFGKNK